jgi:hypothetical protein
VRFYRHGVLLDSVALGSSVAEACLRGLATASSKLDQEVLSIAALFAVLGTGFLLTSSIDLAWLRVDSGSAYSDTFEEETFEKLRALGYVR